MFVEPGRSGPIRDAMRADVAPWVRLVLSLLLLGAPAWAIGLDQEGRDSVNLTGNAGQLEADFREGLGVAAPVATPKSYPAQSNPDTPWQGAIRRLPEQTLATARLREQMHPAPYSHGRVVDPARYLQRTPR